MTLIQLIALGVVVLFFLLTFWGFAKATEERVKILGLVASLAGVAIGFLLQEPRVQEKETTAVRAQAAADSAYEFARTTERQMEDIRSILRAAPPTSGGQVTLPRDSIARIDSIIRTRAQLPDAARFRP